MIPKIVHYVWLGGNPLPANMQKCLDSWKTHFPDYTIMKWDESCLSEVDSLFANEAFAEKKWAFVSDVIRVYALYKYGGIYLDTDVLVYKSFDNLLSYPAFIGRESSLHMKGRHTINYVTTCTFGSEPNNQFIKLCLDYYTNRHFVHSINKDIPSELRQDQRLNSEIFTILLQTRGYNASILENKIQECDSIVVLPSNYFDPGKPTAESYSKHLALGTWRETTKRIDKYTFVYKIQWRLWWCVEKFMNKFNRILIKVN